MKIIDATGEELLALALAVEGDEVKTHASFSEGAAELDLPKTNLSFENTKDGLLVHAGLAGTDKHFDVLVEYDDAKALKEVPGKGLVGFVLKAFR